jgi:Mn2+/Fe2+ NRAMP family transporter
LKKYTALRLFTRYGVHLAVVLVVLAVVADLAAGVAGLIGWPIVVGLLVVIAVLCFVLLVFVDLVRVIVDMLVPPE